jgi:hypothetical protein
MYKIFDLLIESSIPLPELPEVKNGIASFTFQVLEEPLEIEYQDIFHHWFLPDGEVAFSYTKYDEAYFLRFPDLANFYLMNHFNDIRCYPDTGVSIETVRHLLLDQVIPRILGENGHIILHASAIMSGGSAVIFIGETGAGKSTIASSFHQKNGTLISDDCVLLDSEYDVNVMIPSYVGARLWEDSTEAVMPDTDSLHGVTEYSPKKRLILHEGSIFEYIKLPISAIFILASSEDTMKTKNVTIERITGGSVVMEILKHSFILDQSNKANAGDIFSKLGKIVASNISVYSLCYPHEYGILPAVHKTILTTLESNEMSSMS